MICLSGTLAATTLVRNRIRNTGAFGRPLPFAPPVAAHKDTGILWNGPRLKGETRTKDPTIPRTVDKPMSKVLVAEGGGASRLRPLPEVLGTPAFYTVRGAVGSGDPGTTPVAPLPGRVGSNLPARPGEDGGAYGSPSRRMRPRFCCGQTCQLFL
jgi:hypothetical protein